jgi:type IV pilus assembly protein PilC
VPDFAYKARDDHGKMVKGVLAAQDEDHLADLLEAEGLYLVSSGKSSRLARHPWLQGRVSRRDLILFSVHVGTGLAGGISLLEVLRTFADESRHERLRSVVRGIADQIVAGASFSDALDGHPGVFSPLFVSMVRAGEATGQLDKVLHDMVGFLEWQEALASTIKQALTYPVVVFIAVLGLVILLLGFVFPQVIPIFQKVGVALPFPTRALIVASTALQRYWLPGLILLLGVAIGLVLYVRSPAGRLQWDWLLLKLPVLGGIVRRIALSRFARYLAVLYRAGVEFIQSLAVVERLVGNRVIEGAIRDAREEVMGGSLLSEALRRTGVVPGLVIQMVATGEATGDLGETLTKVSQYYDREVQDSVRRGTALLEPAAIALMAGMVLFVALSILLPLWGMIGQIARR